MIMATSAKKHLTIFARDRRATGAGSPAIKAAFENAARATRGIFSRTARNAEVRAAMDRAGITGKAGPHYRRSRSKVHMGQRYQVGSTGYGGVGGREVT